MSEPRRRARWGFVAAVPAVALLGLGCAPKAPPLSPPATKNDAPRASKADAPLAQAHASMKAGKWNQAETLLQSIPAEKKSESELLLAELYLITGRYDEVGPLLQKHPAKSARLFRARALRLRGQLAEAQSLLIEASSDWPLLDELSAKLLLGEILLEEGKRKEAESVLLQLIEAASDDQFETLDAVDKSRAWALTGRAAHLLRSPEDANDAFNEAEQAAPADFSLLLARAELFLEKFDFAHAEEVIDEALKQAPHHPDLLLLSAQLKLESSLAFAEVERLSQQVLKTNPRNSGAHFLLAGVALRDLRISEADRHVAAGLAENPRDLSLLSMKAATRFLAEDPEGLEAVIAQVLELSPGYSDVYRVVGEYAEWEHRYPDIEKLMRRAVRLDREDGRARTLLGLTLVRSGSDAAGVIELRTAFELDPFNVRVLNTLDLYEKTIPKDYVEETYGPFQFRFPRSEAPLLRRYVPALLSEAHQQMRERYAYEPRAPIGIELYEARDQFAVRTSGLPQIAIQGVCFGRKLATMSPIGAPGNLGMTLWHELAHVFHIGLSENRVPRWLTEGLAEWETERRDVGWSRELDLQLHRALHSGSLPDLGSMSRAFTHARRFQDVATAYYASGRLAKWIVESRGEPMAAALVREFGKKKLPEDVVPVVLGAPFEKLDGAFKEWLASDLVRFDSQFVSAEATEPASELRARLKKTPTDTQLELTLGLALLSEGDAKGAHDLFKKVLEKKFEPQAAFAQARLLLALEKKSEAESLLLKLLAEGHDGYEVRMVLARLFLAARDNKAAEEHLNAAVTHDPFSEEPLSLLASVHQARGAAALELAAVKKWAALSEHDAFVHRRLLALLLAQEQYEEAARAGELAIWADLAGFETHRLYGQALARLGDLKRAEFEWESALLCPASPADIQNLSATWSEELTRAGRKAAAAGVPERISKLPVFTPQQ